MKLRMAYIPDPDGSNDLGKASAVLLLLGLASHTIASLFKDILHNYDEVLKIMTIISLSLVIMLNLAKLMILVAGWMFKLVGWTRRIWVRFKK